MDLTFCYQEWPYAQVFKISRGASTHSQLFVAWLRSGDLVGRGECGVLTQYGHTREDLVAGFEAARDILKSNPTRAEMAAAVPNPSVRNALDCAMWDLECKQAGQSIWRLASVVLKPSVQVDITISVDTAEKMCADARVAAAQGYRLLKLKADRQDVVERVAAIARHIPDVQFIVDANEAWDIATLERVGRPLSDLGVVLIEQPLSHLDDGALREYRGPIPICADESCRSIADLDRMVERYQAINIKLDKAGGLTPALELARAAKQRGLDLMLGCSGPTSLGAAPAYVVATLADYVDLDGPALLLEDRAGAMRYEGGRLFAFDAGLWGG